MIAILLSAGFGTRLRPLTNNLPKCLVKINNTCLLEIWLKKLSNCKQIKKIIINTHYKAKLVKKFVENSNYKNKVEIFYEERLLGTAATLSALSNKINYGSFLVIHSDNYLNFEVKDLINAHKKRNTNCSMTMLTFRTKNSKECGTLTCNKYGVVNSYFEKKKTSLNLANGAIYICEFEIIKHIKEHKIKDFSTGVIPYFINKIQSYFYDGFFIDIGTPKKLNFLRNYLESKKLD